MNFTKILLPFLLLALLSLGCRKASTETLDEMVSPSSIAKFTGTFNGIGSENVSGQAKVFFNNGEFMLKLESFYTSNGPDLKVYLSKSAMPSGFISLGNLKSTNGNQVYSISGSPDFTQYKYVLIHCERYNHLFGTAELLP